jgi:hypothetical protein
VTAKASGMYVGYHNHQHEFQTKFDGICAFELFFGNTSPDVNMQMDIGHGSRRRRSVYCSRNFQSSRTIHAKETYPVPVFWDSPRRVTRV